MSDKLEREIEEILKRAEEVMPEDRSRSAKNPSKKSRGLFSQEPSS